MPNIEQSFICRSFVYNLYYIHPYFVKIRVCITMRIQPHNLCIMLEHYIPCVIYTAKEMSEIQWFTERKKDLNLLEQVPSCRTYSQQTELDFQKIYT
jgi:hypothetical protein